jgi:hypothetical protein
MTIARTGESCFNDRAKLVALGILCPTPNCAKLIASQSNIGFLHLRRRAMSLATSSTGPPDLRLTTPSTLLPVPPLLTVIKTHPAIARANRAGCVQCASGVG